VVAEEDAAHCWDLEERGCASSAIFVIFELWDVVPRSHPQAIFSREQFLAPLANTRFESSCWLVSTFSLHQYF
jgi:hypothetical protein